MGSDERARLLREAVRVIASRCPRMIAECYWAGTSAIALEELGHRESMRDELLRTLKTEDDPR